ncbi:MAG: AAA family ATPase [Sandaracinaceae bacterium]
MSDRLTLRAHVVELDDGRRLATLLRSGERFFDGPPPSAYGSTDEELGTILADALSRSLTRREDSLSRYLWKVELHVRRVGLEVHTATAIEKEHVIGKRTIPLRLGFVWSEVEGGGYRIMLPRFRWSLLLEDLESAKTVLEHAVSTALLGEDARWIYAFRQQGEERIIELEPSWLDAAKRDAEREESAWLGTERRPTLDDVADEWVERAEKKRAPRLLGDDPAFLAETPRLARLPAQSLLLVGPPGVGKTTFVGRLAKQLLRWRRDRTPAPTRLWATSADRILAGMIYLGMWQERCQRIVDELDERDELLYVGNLVPFVTPQSDGSSIADLFAPSVLAGTIPLVAECTEPELARARALAPRLVDRFRIVRLQPPKQKELQPLFTTASERLGLDLHPAALERMMVHLERFSRHAQFPGKGFAFLDWLAQNRGGAGRIDPAELSKRFAIYSGLPIELIADERSATIDEVAAQLRRGVVGQEDACRRTAEVIARLRAGLSDPERPIGTLLFVGPTGVGKTELAKQLARYLFGDAERLVRVDCAEHMLAGSAQRLLAVGRGVSSLAMAVQRQPLSVVLLDEIEKAHPEVLDLLLGVLGEGRLTDASGRGVDFRMTIVVMTSNLGVESGGALGFGATAHDDYRAAVLRELRPELVNRLDHIVSFRALRPADVQEIVDLLLQSSLRRAGLLRRNLQLLVDRGARERLAELGFHPVYGARPARRVIEERVFTPLAAKLAADPELRDRRVAVVREGSPAERALSAAERRDAIVIE